MAATFIETEPEGILIPPALKVSNPEDLFQSNVALWHIVDDERALTWCGLFLSQGSGGRPFSETPEDRRCETCIVKFGEGVVRHPDP